MSISLLAVLNPFEVSTIYLSMIEGRSKQELNAIAVLFTIAVAIILLVSFWVGHIFLKLFGLNLPSFEVAGGLILAFIGLGMILPKPAPANSNTSPGAGKQQIAVVPLAIPIAAGPGVIAIVIADAERLHNVFADKAIFTGILLILALIMGMTVKYTPTIGRKLGHTAMQTISRVMGLIITAIALNMLANGMLGLFPGLQ
jgi:multiple antibiotic resistance protein